MNESDTLMAAPFASGTAALIKSKNLSVAPQESVKVWIIMQLIWVILEEIRHTDSDWCKQASIKCINRYAPT
ncbi:S8 family serine peptidase [Candidatus Methanoperedens nitratireducens]|uniref:Uncharacterized protein n=1 Tax=Candidatus Methanoperedens nitratireducens TaxID=1392998 RepID=A0A284VLH3_9EURY|nr:S8 family serine peptidase [Candidatus Methanoperedens nitroreducens]SNQ60136.1 hypothetical protein MNV_1620003 [Candidatus Methanoperedens nitroreducens]